MKYLLINKEGYRPVDLPAPDKVNFSQLYELLGCDIVEFAYYKVGGRVFGFICDDEGRLKHNFVSAIDQGGHVILVGPFLVFSVNAGKPAGMSEEDLNLFEEYSILLRLTQDGYYLMDDRQVLSPGECCHKVAVVETN